MFEVAKKRPPHWPSLELPQRLCDEFNCSHQSGKGQNSHLTGSPTSSIFFTFHIISLDFLDVICFGMN